MAGSPRPQRACISLSRTTMTARIGVQTSPKYRNLVCSDASSILSQACTEPPNVRLTPATSNRGKCLLSPELSTFAHCPSLTVSHARPFVGRAPVMLTGLFPIFPQQRHVHVQFARTLPGQRQGRRAAHCRQPIHRRRAFCPKLPDSTDAGPLPRVARRVRYLPSSVR